MDSGVVGHGMAEEEDGQTSWTIEDDLVGSENGESSNSSTCEKYGRTVLSEQDEAFLLSGLEEIEGLFQQKEEDETTLDLHLDVDDPEVKRNFQTIGQSNWLYDTLHRSKKKPDGKKGECEGRQTPERDQTRRRESSTPERPHENMQTRNYFNEDAAQVEKCDSDADSVSERDSGSANIKLAQYPWMGNTLLQILGDSFVTRIQDTQPLRTNRRISDNSTVSKCSSNRDIVDEAEDELTSIECEACDNKDDPQEGPESTLDLSGNEDQGVPLMTSSIIDIDDRLLQEEEEEKKDDIDPTEGNLGERNETIQSNQFSRYSLNTIRIQSQISRTQEPLAIQPFLDIDNVELTERFKKIVSAFGDKQKNTFSKAPWLPNTSGTDEADSAGEISMDKMMTVIKRLDMEDNWFHYFMNSLPMIGKGSNKVEHEELLAEMHEICPSGSGRITLNRFKIFHVKHLNEAPPPVKVEDRRPSWKRISLKWREKKRASDKLLKYFRAIAEAKKMNFTPTRVFFPLLTLLILGTHIFVLSQESQRSHQLQSALQFDTKKHGEVWRYFTYSLLHASGEHIVVNLFLLFFVGFSMELIHGTLRPLLVYFLGVVTSSMFFFVFDCGTLVGCSGGVFSLVAASLSSIILNWKEDKAVLVKIHPKKAPFAFAGKMLRILKLTALVVFACVSFGSAAVRRYNRDDIGVSMVNHIFGALTGFFAGFHILRDSKEDWWEKHLKFVCWSVFCVGFGLALGVNVFASRKGVGFWSWWGAEGAEENDHC